MERVKPDLWSLGSRLSSITSFFALPLTDGHSLSIGKGFLSTGTGTCGLGWRFVFSAKSGDYHQETWGEKVTLRKTIFNIFFAPHLVTTTDLRELSITITSENLTHTADGSTTISLPTHLQRIPLASYVSAEDFTGVATVTIKVEFQFSFTLSSISEPPTHKVQQALCRSLAGDELGDTRFSPSHSTPGHFRQQFTLTPEGHSAYLDNLLVSDEATTTGAELANMTHGVMYDTDSDSDLDSDSDETDLDVDDPKIKVTDAKTPAQGEKKATSSGTPQLGQDERAIFIRDTAFKTWKSLVFYLYTREVNFRGLSSSKSEFSTPAPSSPKSMYRLADKIELSELKLLALDAIARDLSEGNIVAEVFSRFTSMYPEVQKVEVEFLMKVLTPAVFEDLMQKMKSVVAGNLPHCFDVVAAIMREMNMRGVGDEERHGRPAAVLPSRPGSPVSKDKDIWDHREESPKEIAVTLEFPMPWQATSAPFGNFGSKRGKNPKEQPWWTGLVNK